MNISIYYENINPGSQLFELLHTDSKSEQNPFYEPILKLLMSAPKLLQNEKIHFKIFLLSLQTIYKKFEIKKD